MAAAAGLLVAGQAAVAAVQVQVEVTSNAPADGVYLTPVWVGFHNGSFDSYNSGLSAQPGLERIAEDGDATQLSTDFGDGKTYVDTSGGPAVSATVDSGQAGGERVQGSVGGGPIGPGSTHTAMFMIDQTGENQYFSYASMVIASSDYFIANGSAAAHDLSGLMNIGDEVSFTVGASGSVNDAGTEVNDFATSAANGLFGIPGGQTGPDQGADEGGVVASVTDPYDDFLNRPTDFDTNFPNFQFNDSGLYPNGIATVTISVVPEPASMSVLMGLGAWVLGRRRR